MPDYEIRFARSARKELEDLDRGLQGRIIDKIEGLGHLPRPSGCVRLTGRNRLWRVRIGDYLVVYGIDDDHRQVDVMVIRHRHDVYRQF
ncbi:MAG: type II toxin-antitoxin system RelE/ParE family toxin [Elusimicrobia bacterium]|nr:type II toxin-antitoxin system RelE/ParE family toxin [Elusimicrobiota bacterium]